MNSVSIDKIYKEFGNVPKYCEYEGSLNGFTYLCCIDVSVDVKNIFTGYGYEYYNSSYEMKIDPSMYNSNYTIHSTYRREEEPYKLVLE